MFHVQFGKKTLALVKSYATVRLSTFFYRLPVTISALYSAKPVVQQYIIRSFTHSQPLSFAMSSNPHSGQEEPPLKKLNSGQAMDISHDKVFQDIFTPELQKLKEVCDRNGMEIRIAGGAVRDILMKIVPHDLDFATTKTPDEMNKIFTDAKIRIINYGSRAEEHGTVVVRIDDKENFEITTTRSDEKTDGRHATVIFHQDWEKDANRRDLTINSMFLGLDGKLYDFFNGYNDLEEKKVRFVGKAEERITEDYLRIMRYFRFYGRIKALQEEHDPETVECIRKHAPGLQGVAGERIWVELKKVLKGHFADHQMKHIMELGVGKQIGLPEGCDTAEFDKVYEKTVTDYPEITESALLAALLKNEQEVLTLNKRLKVSKVELNTMLFIVEHRNTDKTGETKYYKDLIMDSSESKQCHSRCIQLAAYMADRTVVDELTAWELPKLPFSAKFLLGLGVPKGRRIATFISQVRDEWKKSNFEANTERLESFAEQLYKESQKTGNQKASDKGTTKATSNHSP